jgi:hypothetical protein
MLAVSQLWVEHHTGAPAARKTSHTSRFVPQSPQADHGVVTEILRFACGGNRVAAMIPDTAQIVA